MVGLYRVYYGDVCLVALPVFDWPTREDEPIWQGRARSASDAIERFKQPAKYLGLI
jgi:hypothetical protein